MNGSFDHSSEPTTYINDLSPEDARQYFLISKSYFDMDLPPYFNFQPLLEFACSEASQLEVSDILKWKPQNDSDVNYSLLHNKDGEIGCMRRFHPIDLMCS